MPDNGPTTSPVAPHATVAALAHPDAVLARDSARLARIDTRRLASYQQMQLHRAELTAWLLELLVELFGDQFHRMMFNQEEGPFGGYTVQLVAVWARDDRLLWRGPHAEHLEAHGYPPIGAPLLAGIEQRSRTTVEDLIEQIQSVDYTPWFADVGLHLDHKGMPLVAPDSCPWHDLREVEIDTERDNFDRLTAQIARLAAQTAALRASDQDAGTRPSPLPIRDLTAAAHRDPAGNPYASVVLTLGTGDEITVTVHESLGFPDTVNVEIDGDFRKGKPSLRIACNDGLIHDSTGNDQPIPDPRHR
jgi:hypothetical protein